MRNFLASWNTVSTVPRRFGRLYSTGLAAVLSLAFASRALGADLTLSWQDNSNNETGFAVERAPSLTDPFVEIGKVGANVTKYIDPVPDAATRCYRIFAFNVIGKSGYSNSDCGTANATLTVAKAGAGIGTVTSAPAGIDCGAVCTGKVPGNSLILLTAAAAPGSVFAGWSGACSGATKCQVTMSQARAATATFDLIPPPPAPTVMIITGTCSVPGECLITLTPVP